MGRKAIEPSLVQTAAVALLFLTCGVLDIQAQSPAASPSPTPSAEVLRLQEEKTQAELRKAIAEANKAELEAKFPKPATTPLTGETKVEGALIESQMASYAQMAVAANKLVQQLKDSKLTINTLAVYNDADVKLLLSYKVALNQLELMKKGYDELIESSPPPCLETGPELLTTNSLEAKARSALVGPVPVMTLARSIFGSFVDLTSLLRTNVDVKGQVFDIEELALASEVFRAARADDGLRSTSLYYPLAFPPNLDVKADEMKSQLLSELDALNHLKAYGEGLANGLLDIRKEITKTEAAIEALKADVVGLKARKEAAEAKVADLEKIYGSSNVSPRMNRVPPEKRELMMELQRTIASLRQQLDQIEREPDGKLAKARNELARLQGIVDCLLSKLKPGLQDPDKLEDTIARLRAKNDQFAKFVEAVAKADSISGLNSLTSYIKAEMMLAALRGADGTDTNFYWLQLKVLKAGGNNRIKTNLVVDIFTGGNRLSHSGGSVVEYILFDRNGRAVAADIFTEYSGYIKSDRIKKLPNPAKVKDSLDQ